MITKIQVLLSVLHCILVTAEKPTRTDKLPVMEALSDDPDHVLVDYAGCFDVQDFGLLDTVSVHVGDKNVGVATRNYSEPSFANSQKKVYQQLVENAKIKAKLNGCESHKFYVRITFKDEQENTKTVNSHTTDYVPESFKALIKSEICMKSNSLFLPLDAMKKSHPQFAACHEQIYIKRGDSKEPLQDGLNSLENVGTSIDIVIKQKFGTFDLQVDMEVFKQKTCSALGFDLVTLALVIVSSVLGVVVLVVVVAWCVWKKKKNGEDEETEILDMNPEYGADYKDDKESELKDTNDYYFYAKEEDNIEVTDTNEYYD
eukprot:GFUD01003881.1.p1 GENE.GFUD01003881.1~~GFUD01003881.1.p1  ORF type:complete len:316 (+),score=99.46 GFUD01003881.1:68-1015(+)